jgi:(p)ppGpp synthase/HD superfamily hydrolase
MGQPQAQLTHAVLTERFTAAVEYAQQLHASQRRKGSGAPYLAHLLSVAALVLEYRGSEDEAIAALLHDAVEDQGGARTLEEIRRRFGDRVADTVAGCTEEQWHEHGRKWRERKDAFLDALRHADASVRLVVAADKLHNAYSYLRDYAQQGPAVWSSFKDGHRGVTWFLRSACDALRAGGDMPILQELDAVVGRLEHISQT